MHRDSPVIKNLFTRRSIRGYKSDPIPDEDIQLMLECIEAAPSAGNLQPWFIYVIKNQQIKKQLCTLSFDQKSVEEAPVIFAICARPEESAEKYEKLGAEFFCLQDTAAATQNLLLAAHAMGYGSLWVGIVKEREIAECIGLAPGEKPIALVAVGKAAIEPDPMVRKGVKNVSKVID